VRSEEQETSSCATLLLVRPHKANREKRLQIVAGLSGMIDLNTQSDMQGTLEMNPVFCQNHFVYASFDTSSSRSASFHESKVYGNASTRETKLSSHPLNTMRGQTKSKEACMRNKLSPVQESTKG
jgi:hypothetical protein